MTEASEATGTLPVQPKLFEDVQQRTRQALLVVMPLCEIVPMLQFDQHRLISLKVLPLVL
jgi:hypothetical protein